MLTIRLTAAELAEVHRRATEAGFRVTADWVRGRILDGFTPPADEQPTEPASDG